MLREIKICPLSIKFVRKISQIICLENIKTCILTWEANDLYVKNDKYQNLWKWTLNIASILNNSKSLIMQIYEKIYWKT